MKNNNEIIMYTTDDGITRVEATFDGDTVWLSLDQMSELFQRNKSTVSRHIIKFLKKASFNSPQLLQILQQFKMRVIGK